MKKFDLFFATILVPIDYIALLLAGSVAYFLRFADIFERMRPIIFDLAFSEFFRIVAVVAIGWIAIFALSGLYTIGRKWKKFDELKRIILACTTALGVVLAVMVFSREFFDSRFILLAAWGLSIMFVWFARLILRIIRSILLRTGIGLKQVSVVGRGASAKAVAEFFNRTPKYGFKVIFQADGFTKEVRQKLTALVKQRRLDQIIYINENGISDEMKQLLEFADEYNVTFRYSAGPLRTHGAGIEFDTLAGVPLMELKRTRLEGWGRVYKRIFDIIGSILLIVITSPIMLLGALITVLSGFPIIFRNERRGEKGKLFNTFKFRTMHSKYCVGKQFGSSKKALEFENELIAKQSIKQGPVPKIKNDPRVTAIGRFLRKTSIDELPQLFNVLGGSMSLVGPRPHQPREIKNYEQHHKRVFTVKPGMTGLPQISGRSDLSFEEEVRLDTYYIEHWSLKLDIIILLKTPFAVVGHKGTY